MKIKAGEVWKITSRMFDGVIKLNENIDTKKDSFFEAKVVEGTKHYLNRESKEKDSIISFRTTLTDFIKKLD